MTQHLSLKLKRLSFFAVLMVLWIHAYNSWPRYLIPSTTIVEESFNLSAFIQYFFSNGTLRFVIPLLFAISGYLFFQKFAGGDFSYRKQIGKRARTLLIPYLLWNSLGVLLVVLARITPWIQTGMPSYMHGITWLDFLLGYLIGPVNFPLWYLRDLFLISLLAPALGWLLRQRLLASLTLALLAGGWFAESWTLIPSLEGIFFFALGATLALRTSPASEILEGSPGQNPDVGAGFLERHRAFLVLVLALLTLALGIWRTWLAYQPVLVPQSALPGSLYYLLHVSYKGLQVLSLLTVWLGYDLVFPRKDQQASQASVQTADLDARQARTAGGRFWLPATFVIFAGHQPLMNILGDNLLAALGHGPEAHGNPWVSLVFYLVYPVFVALFLAAANKALGHVAPGALALLTGYRVLGKKKQISAPV